MAYSTASPPDQTAEPDMDLSVGALAAAAMRLAKVPVLGVERRTGGGNNRVYRIDTPGEALALKAYDAGVADPRGDRLGREFAALSFLTRHGVDTVPAAVAADPQARLGLYGWIEGEPVSRTADGRRDADMDALLAFVATLDRLGTAAGAAELGPATEACTSAVELLYQVERRLTVLSAVRDEPELKHFLSRGLYPALTRAERALWQRYRLAGLAVEAQIPRDRRILSPSDFGFHNALRRPDGRLALLDMEYFGWDDPVKLTADTLWHPGSVLSPGEQRRWLDGMVGIRSADPDFMLRLTAQLPLYGLRWCAILLNEFLPERWERRVYAGNTGDWEQAKAVQLDKAAAWLADVMRLLALPAGAGPADMLPFDFSIRKAPV